MSAIQPQYVTARPRRSVFAILGRVLLHIALVLVGLGAFVAYQHFSLAGASTAATVSLVAAAGLVLSPVRALLREFLALEGVALHAAHGLVGLGLMGMTFGGLVTGAPLLPHAAEAPFAMMAAAQALMHQNTPRSAEQAAALRQFATSLPEIAQIANGGGLASPANAQRAIAVVTDLVGKAQALGETELRADPAYQSALRTATTRVGLSLGLDAIDRAIGGLAANPATATAVPELRRKLAAARKAAGG